MIGTGPGTSAEGGTYTLLIELGEPATITFGAAGDRALEAGWYAYTGSALGSGGFARVERHNRLAAGEHDARHWHVDYLLGHGAARLDDDVRTAGVDAECRTAAAIVEADGVEPIPGVGATDCDCGSHLAYAATASLDEAVRAVHRVESA